MTAGPGYGGEGTVDGGVLLRRRGYDRGWGLEGAWPLSLFWQPAEVVLMLSAARLELETLNSETRRDADAIRARLQGEWPTSCRPPLQQQEVSHPASSLSRSPAEAPPSGPGR